MSRNILYWRESFRLLLCCLMIAITAFFSAPAHSQSQRLGRVTITVVLNDNLGQNFGLVIKKLNSEMVVSAIRARTTADGSVSLSLTPGDYVVESEKPLIVNGKSYEWSIKLKIESGSRASLELKNEDATITAADEALKS